MSVRQRNIAVIIVAAGSGTRMNNGSATDVPKQYQALGKHSVILKTINAFCTHAKVDIVLPIISSEHSELYNASITSHRKLLEPVIGGNSRQSSVRNGLEFLKPHAIDLVLIHDAARPFISEEVITQVINGAAECGGAIPALPVTDTLKYSRDGKIISSTIDRTKHYVAQTPQAFDYAKIVEAHSCAANTTEVEFTDDASIAEWAGLTVAFVNGDPKNKKITFQNDLIEARNSMNDNKDIETRVGTGYDVHAFEDGDAVILGGITIPFEKKLKGHSDADVALHTITDAIYGALADGDIGQHFPPSDDKWKNTDSAVFLKHAISRMSERGGRLLNVDLTIICELPKIGPHCLEIRKNIADICSTSMGRVSVKATTSERLGFTGRGEGIAAQAAVAIELPVEE